MQQINHWPDVAEITLPEAVSRDLIGQLLEPFDSEGEAKEFWKETRTTIIILEPFHSDTTSREFWQEASSDIIILDSIDTIEDTDQLLTWNQIGFMLTYPEYTVPLSNGYVLLVAIVNDSGSCIYLVVPPELSHIIPQEVITHE